MLAVAVATMGLVGCSSSGTTASSGTRRSSTTTTTITTTTRAATATAPPAIDWSQLHNPIVASADHALKDAALVAVNGTWFMAFSTVDTHGTWRIGIEHSSDLHTWSPMTFMPHDPAVEGEASPDVVRAPDGQFVITYQSFVHDVGRGLAKLYYRTTSDFVHFSSARQLLRPLFTAPSARVIDAALAWTPAGLIIGFKTGESTQSFEIARSPSGSLDGPWRLIGKPDIRVFGDTIENYEFLRIDRRWKLLATSNQLDRPFLFDLEGDASRPDGWLKWSVGRELQVPQESWNTGTGITGATYDHANCAYLVDLRPRDGHFYLVYEDAPELSSFNGSGHGKLSLARSTDLVHWSVPPR
jgi:hypothetical protein